MGGLSIWHLLILALFILLLFGGNRFSAMMGDVAKGLKSFKHGMTDDDDAKNRQQAPTQQLPPQAQAPQAPIDITPRPADPVAPPPPVDDQTR